MSAQIAMVKPSRLVLALLQLRSFRWRSVAFVRRLGVGARYAAGRLTAEDAQRLHLDCRYAAGWHPLVMLCAEDVMHEAVTWGGYADTPVLRRYIHNAVSFVGNKWSGDGETGSYAREWALRVAIKSAEEDGVVLQLSDPSASGADPCELEPN